jgi:hypothetical protein|tara:strand:+ start:621 stop:968 length:348 start_codon:yes stop_codon:yes gene_type:complete
MKMKSIKVFNIVGKNAISIQAGRKLHHELENDILKGNKIELNFQEVEVFASPFFNSSIGVLLKDRSIDELLSLLTIINLEGTGKDLLNHVITNALRFYDSSQSVTQVLNKKSSED